MVSELHRLGFQHLRIMPYEYPLAWRLCVAPRDRFSKRNTAYIPDLVNDGQTALYSSASENEYFGWEDARNDDARMLADKFIERFPQIASRGRGRDWTYAGWLSELVGHLERGESLPFVMSEYFEPAPEDLTALPIREFATHTVSLSFPLPPSW